MLISAILALYENFKAKELSSRFFKHHNILALLNQLPHQFELIPLGNSYQGRAIHAIKWGKGNKKIMLWSQMHGNEATGTMALFDLFNFLQTTHPLVEILNQNCELHFIPMVNPDGAEVFTRRSSQQIDINRDYLNEVTIESSILKNYRAQTKPDFGFNLHDQVTTWSVSGTKLPATLSFLAPAYDIALNNNLTRKAAMQVISSIYKELHPLLNGHIGLFDDEFEPRAFGDNFQKEGTSTILIEAGGYYNDDEKQIIRSYYFAAILIGLNAIATQNYQSNTIEEYFTIPKNSKELFHMIIHNVAINNSTVSVGLNFEEEIANEKNTVQKIYTIADIGDLQFSNAYQFFDAKNADLIGNIKFEEKANFKLIQNEKTILSFLEGKLQ